jgi:glycosyltransferase involved in cell wall biosynthesis/Flp pilus assembly protein TadD
MISALVKRLNKGGSPTRVSTVKRYIVAGNAANAAKQWPVAQAAYEAALALNPKLSPIWVQYGHALKEQGFLDKAESAYRHALTLEPRNADTHLQLGHVLKLQGRTADARRAYATAFHLDPMLDDGWRELIALEHKSALPTNSVDPSLSETASGQTTPYSPVEANDGWKARFKLIEFRALNPALSTDATTIEQAHQIFLQCGVEQLAPIALDAIFDPDFYRMRYPEAAGLSAVEAYRHWLFQGVSVGYCCSEADLLEHKLIGRRSVPSAFDWASYAKVVLPHQDGTPPTRLDALEHLLTRGHKAGYPIPFSEGDAAEVMDVIADYHHGRGDLPAAIDALRSALSGRSDLGRLHHKLGDYYLEMCSPDLAATSYRRALETGYKSMWTYLHLVDQAIRSEDFEQAYSLLAASRGKFAGEATWRAKLTDAINAQFNHSLLLNRSLLKVGPEETAETQLSASLQRIVRALRELDDLPAALPPCHSGHVVIFALHLVPQCLHYRVQQRCEQLDYLGIPYRLFAGHQATEAREALIGARALIVYREPAYPENIRLMLHAAAMAVPSFYDIDDLIFDAAHYPDPFTHYQDQIGYDEYIGLLQGRTLYRFAISLCDTGIASTPALCGHVAAVTRSGVCHLVPNGLDSRNLPFLKAPRPSDTDNVFIFYGSGTRAHNRNFNECASSALVSLLSARPHARLVIVGYLDLDSAFDAVMNQVIRLDFNSDVDAYWSLLAEVDINLATLVPGEMNDCKSEIKWLEAAVAGVPSIVSATRTYRDVLLDGQNALLACAPVEFEAALFRLVDDAALRRRIGGAARRTAIERYSLNTTAARIARFLPAQHDTDTPVQRLRTRILVVNVFFPPQTFGGATRVVRDNVDDLLDRYGSEFELAVLTTDAGGSAGRSRVGGYRSIPVFRFAPELGYKPEETFQNEEIAAWFSEVVMAWKPDIVHFHCIQYLTASLPEACTSMGIPFIVTLHDGWWLSRNQFFLDHDEILHLPLPRTLVGSDPSSRLLAETHRRHFLATQLDAAAAVVAVSKKFGDIYRGAGVVCDRIIPNGLSGQFTKAPRPRSTRKGRVRIGHIAGWAAHKGIHLVQAALLSNRFANLQAVLIDHRREESYQLSEVWGNTPVIIRGKVEQEQVGALYDDIDVLVAPSIWPESYGLISREALHYGVWVIASDLGALADDVIEGVNGFKINVDSTVELVAVLHEIDSDPDRFKASPPVAGPLRLASEQAAELAELYRAHARPWKEPDLPADLRPATPDASLGSTRNLPSWGTNRRSCLFDPPKISR